MRNVPICYGEKDIEESIVRDYKLKPNKIFKYTTNYMRQKNIESTMWRLQFEAGTDKKKIFEINRIGYQQGIVVEEIRNRALTQCLKCWRYEHTHSNCSYQKRCWFCDKIHEDDEQCDENNIEGRTPWCVNCRSNTHSAISKECEVYIRINERRGKKEKTQNNELQTATINTQNQSTNNNKTHSYANTVKKNLKKNTSDTSNNETNQTIVIMQQMMQQQQQFMENIMKQLSPLLNKTANAH